MGEQARLEDLLHRTAQGAPEGGGHLRREQLEQLALAGGRVLAARLQHLRELRQVLRRQPRGAAGPLQVLVEHAPAGNAPRALRALAARARRPPLLGALGLALLLVHLAQPKPQPERRERAGVYYDGHTLASLTDGHRRLVICARQLGRRVVGAEVGRGVLLALALPLGFLAGSVVPPGRGRRLGLGLGHE
eukprot:scaffold91920_cov45-Phaeocystis_antarctica.AAC.1